MKIGVLMASSNQYSAQTTPHLYVGLIGDPVAHSYSPRFQQAAFDALSFPAHYDLWHTPAQTLAERIHSLYDEHCLGANVTIPHKEGVLPMLDGIDPLAAHIGAVNTIVQRNGFLHGYNTDGPGLLHAMQEQGVGELLPDGQVSLKGYTAVLLGAGGAARGAAFALASASVERMIIVNRHLERAQRLATEVQRHFDGSIFSLSDPLFLIPHHASIIVNATSVGMYEDISPLPVEILAHFDSETFVFDMIYNPSQTHLICQTRTMGLRTSTGFSILLHQGALAFELWTGRQAPLDVMRASLL